MIRQSIVYAESAERAVPILSYRPARGSDYLSLAGEILRRLGMHDLLDAARRAERRAGARGRRRLELAAVSDADSPAALEATIARYNDAWNAHDLDAIMSMHAPDMVFENHTAGESAAGRGRARAHRLDLRDLARHPLRGPAHLRPRRAGRPGVDGDRDPREPDDAAATSSPSRPGKTITWNGLDVIPFEDGLVKRKDVYSDSVSILRQLGLLD